MLQVKQLEYETFIAVASDKIIENEERYYRFMNNAAFLKIVQDEKNRRMN